MNRPALPPKPFRWTTLARFVTLIAAAYFLVGSHFAEAKCTKRVADPLIVQRYQECNAKEMLSYLYNNIVTPYSYDCSKKIKETCKREACGEARDAEDFRRCQLAYVQVLNTCQTDLEGAAKMARCKDTKVWPVESAPSAPEPDTTVSRQLPAKVRSPGMAPAAPQAMRASQSSVERR